LRFEITPIVRVASRREARRRHRYATLPVSANQLLRVIELKQLVKKLGFSRTQPENKQYIVLEDVLKVFRCDFRHF
jgi:transcription-repair coupling factor (superfamily II helicase)